jgi:protein OS-9
MLLLWLLSSPLFFRRAYAGLHSLPEDPFAFPKYRVSFLNGFPLLNDTADKWLREGLRGGEAEFLDQPWTDAAWDVSRQMKEIGSGKQDVRFIAARAGRLPTYAVLL